LGDRAGTPTSLEWGSTPVHGLIGRHKSHFRAIVRGHAGTRHGGLGEHGGGSRGGEGRGGRLLKAAVIRVIEGARWRRGASILGNELFNRHRLHDCSTPLIKRGREEGRRRSGEGNKKGSVGEGEGEGGNRRIKGGGKIGKIEGNQFDQRNFRIVIRNKSELKGTQDDRGV